MIGIYKITNIINNKVYIGQSIDIKRRWIEETNCKQVNDHLLNSINKYGIDSFLFEVIEECTPEELNYKEIYYIQKYESYKKNKGYNKTLGGEGGQWTDERKLLKSIKSIGAGNSFYGKKHNEETKRLQSEIKKGEKHPSYGKNHSEKTKKIMSEKAMGELNHNAKSVDQYTITGEYIATYGSISTAARINNIGKSGIKNMLCGYTKQSGGYIWKYNN